MELAAPDIVGYVAGWRGFDMKADKLLSLNGHVAWAPGPNTARCNPPPHMRDYHEATAKQHEAPAADCGCGLYAYHDATFPGTGVIGLVKCWGRIAVHETGIRAQYAELVCLVDLIAGMFNIEGWDRATRDTLLAYRASIETAAKRYGVPLLDTTGAAARRFPTLAPVPEEMRPEIPHDELQEYASAALFHQGYASGYAATAAGSAKPRTSKLRRILTGAYWSAIAASAAAYLAGLIR